MDIYWIKDKKKQGPATVPDVISLVQMGELAPDTLGWHAGCPGWAPLRELPALADFLGELQNKSKGSENMEEPKALPPIPPVPLTRPQEEERQTVQMEVTLPASQTIEDTSAVSLPLPRTRLMARLIDSSLYAAIAAGVVYLLQIPFTDMLLPLFWAPMVFIEAALLTYRGTTPGKRIMGIAVSTFGREKSPMTFSRALFRSLSVNVIGMGCYLFPVGAVTMLISYFMLTRRGITMWDARCMTLPLQRRKATVRHFLLAGVVIYAALQLMSQAIIRTPGTLEMLEQTSPEMARTLREMMPDLPAAGNPPGATVPTTPQPLQ